MVRRAFVVGVVVVRVRVAWAVQIVEPSLIGRVGEDSITKSRGHLPKSLPRKKSKADRGLLDPRSSTTSAAMDV
eukprot:scaffold36312_cov132-Isochrysis_galbana.AAC.2